MNPVIQLKKPTPAILIVLACFGLSPMAHALLPPPPPDGGYPNNNTAEGAAALFNVTTGVSNTAIGGQALFSNTNGSQHGQWNCALSSNTNGNQNTASGQAALSSNTTGSFNTANGVAALVQNTTGFGNTANGGWALQDNIIGQDNTAIGYFALANNTGSNNIALGKSAGATLTTGANNIDIGALGAAGESNKIRIGKQGMQNGTFIAGISGVAVMGSQVLVNASGKLGVAACSARFKKEIKPMDKSSEAILALKPVTFHYKKEVDPDGILQFGLLAEQVEKVNSDLIAAR